MLFQQGQVSVLAAICRFQGQFSAKDYDCDCRTGVLASSLTGCEWPMANESADASVCQGL